MCVGSIPAVGPGVDRRGRRIKPLADRVVLHPAERDQLIGDIQSPPGACETEPRRKPLPIPVGKERIDRLVGNRREVVRVTGPRGEVAPSIFGPDAVGHGVMPGQIRTVHGSRGRTINPSRIDGGRTRSV